VCQDARTPGRDLNRDGLRAVIGIVAAGGVDAVVVASLSALSPDKVVQEVMIDDLRARGVTVLTSDEAELSLLEDPSPDQVRLLVRDVLEKARRHQRLVGSPEDPPDGAAIHEEDDSDVIIELVPPSQPAGITNLSRSS
jgi:hypothetical protein